MLHPNLNVSKWSLSWLARYSGWSRGLAHRVGSMAESDDDGVCASLASGLGAHAGPPQASRQPRRRAKRKAGPLDLEQTGPPMLVAIVGSGDGPWRELVLSDAGAPVLQALLSGVADPL